ncbi:MAG: prolipoprotein diacylglyceryl transferase, partial [Mucinivorans sp.]
FIFVRANETMPMHPTQIYEALAYILLFAVLMLLYWRTKVSNKRGVMFGVFLIWLFGARFLIESIKNVQEAFETTMKLNMGQWLSIPFVVAGVVILVVALRRAAQPYTNMPQPKAPTRQQKRHAK